MSCRVGDRIDMKKQIFKFIKVAFGLFLFGVGVVMTINANLGLAPWDVFHQGLSKTFGITIGTASIIMGFIIVMLDIYLGQNIGWATIMNMVLIGTFMDLLMLNNLIPTFDSNFLSSIMLVLGLLIQGYGCWIYLSVGMGAGPRDGLMVVLTKKTGKSVGFSKAIVDVFATVIGFLLGGSLGIGTLVMALFSGRIYQFAFKTVKFDVKAVENRFIQDDIKSLVEKYKMRNEKNPS